MQILSQYGTCVEILRLLLREPLCSRTEKPRTMSKKIIFSIVLNTCLVTANLFAQNTGIGEPNPGSKLSVKGNASVGTTYSVIAAPADGQIIEGQVGIGTSSPSSCAILDVQSTQKGVLIPRLTTANRTAIVAPCIGLLVFDTDLNAFCFNTTNGWVTITGQGGGAVGATGPTGPQGMPGFPGANGINGMDGTNGTNGVNGNVWLSGTTVPSSGQGSVNDFYINTSTGAYYKKTSSSVWTLQGSLVGPAGTAGANGSTWWSGNIAPTPSQGSINDFYINTTNGNYYKKTGANTWSLLGSLRGPAGTTGATGPAGANGAQGPTGPAGANGLNGATGPQGANGTNGTNGSNGATGPTGPTGPAGSGSGGGGLSGTTNYIVKFTSANTGGNALLYDNGSGIGIGTVSPSYPLHVSSSAGISGYFTNNNGANDPLWGYNNAAAGSAGGCGVVGISSQTGNLAAGLWGENYNTSGTGVVGFGNSAGAVLMAGGSGGAFTGTITGLYAKASSSNPSQSVYTDNFGSIVRVNYWSGSTQYKIQGAGTVSTIVKDVNNKEVVMHATETPEIYLQDYGQSALVNGKAHISIDPTFAKNVIINNEHPLRAYVQLEGDCKGVYVSAKCSSGFDVIELNGGTSNTPFQWTIVCNRADETLDNGRISKNADVRFEPAAEVEKVLQSKGQLAGKNRK